MSREKEWHHCQLKCTARFPIFYIHRHVGLRMITIIIHHHHRAAGVSRGWAKASACRLKITVLCFPLPYRVAPVFVQVVSSPLGWSPLSSFLVEWSPCGDTRGPLVVFEVGGVSWTISFQVHTLLIDHIHDL